MEILFRGTIDDDQTTARFLLGNLPLGGLLLWVFGRPAKHIGASGLIFGLITFLMLSGVMEKRIVPMIVAVVVGFLYGGALLWGILPHFGSQISWDGHLCSAIAGGIAAYGLTRESRPQKTPARTE